MGVLVKRDNSSAGFQLKTGTFILILFQVFIKETIENIFKVEKEFYDNNYHFVGTKPGNRKGISKVTKAKKKDVTELKYMEIISVSITSGLK